MRSPNTVTTRDTTHPYMMHTSKFGLVLGQQVPGETMVNLHLRATHPRQFLGKRCLLYTSEYGKMSNPSVSFRFFLALQVEAPEHSGAAGRVRRHGMRLPRHGTVSVRLQSENPRFRPTVLLSQLCAGVDVGSGLDPERGPDIFVVFLHE